MLTSPQSLTPDGSASASRGENQDEEVLSGPWKEQAQLVKYLLNNLERHRDEQEQRIRALEAAIVQLQVKAGFAAIIVGAIVSYVVSKLTK